MNTTNRIRVLVVDDTEAIRALLAQELGADERITVVAEAADGAEAVSLSGSLRPDAVVLDLAMPVMDGLEAAPRILERSPRSKIVVLSAFESATMAERALSAGAHRYLEKGLSLSEIRDCIVDLCADRIAVITPEGASIAPAPKPPEPSLPAPSLPALGDGDPNGTLGLIAMVMHDLRNPLAIVAGSIELLTQRGQSLDPTWLEILELARRNIRRMTELTEDVVDVARFQSGHLRLEIVPTDIVAVLRGVLADLALPDGRWVEPDLSPELPLVLADPIRQHQILWNLLSNAVKFSPAESEIVIEVRPWGDEVVVAVTDSGPGIHPEDARTLFEPFTQLTKPHDHARREGSGLGLYICQALVEAQGGRIWVDSDGDGSRFSYTIPAAPRD